MEFQDLKIWTSGSRASCGDTWGWCSTHELFTSDVEWEAWQPDNLTGNQKCVVLNLRQTPYLTYSALNDVDCLRSGPALVCEVSAQFKITFGIKEKRK